MLEPIGEHELLIFWIEFVILLAVARGLGAAVRRLGQPAVVGELTAGIILGPTVLGRLFPGVAESIFPGGEVQSALILAVAWIGIILLLAATGFETDLRLLSRLGRASAGVTIGSLVVPLACGFGLGLLLPDAYIGERASRTIFALFIAVALSISALPVIARILTDMRLMRRNFGQVTLAAGMVNDLIGWLLLGTLIGLVNTGRLEAGPVALTVLAIVGFVFIALTIGQRIVDDLLRRSQLLGGFNASLSMTMLVILVFGAVTHAIGVEAVIGAFIAGIVMGRSRYLPRPAREAIENISASIFAPVFFATAGLYVDLGVLRDPTVLAAALAVILVAAFAKLVGSYVGGRLSRLTSMESLAAGIGLNARGAMEIVLATVGLGLGVLNQVSYSAVVLMALVTSVVAPPLLLPVLRRLEATPEETERLKREELLAASIIANASTALLPTRGGENSLIAARTLDLVLQEDASVTVLTVDPSGRSDPQRERRADAVIEALEGRTTHRLQETADEPVEAILAESRLGYDLVALGLNEEFRGTHELSGNLQELLAGTEVPVLLVRRPFTETMALAQLPVRRVLVPATGTRPGLAAEEIAYVLAARVDADVDVVHVVSRPDRSGPEADRGQLQRARDLAGSFGRVASALLRHDTMPYEAMVATAEERQADLIVLGAQVRSHDGRPFLGETAEYVLEHASPAVAVVVFPTSAVSPA